MTLPVTLWFLDRGKRQHRPRRHRSSSSTLARSSVRSTAPIATSPTSSSSSSRTSCGCTAARSPSSPHGENALFAERFPDGAYADVKGLCKVATIEEIEAQGWSLNPGRYVGTEVEELDDEVFEEKLAAAQAELRSLGARARELERAWTTCSRELLSS